MNKLKRRTESTNFLTAILTLLLTPFAYNGIELPIDFLGGLLGEVVNKNFGALLLAAPQLINITLKIVSKVQDKWSWVFLKSKNFITQACTVLFMLLVYLGVITPEIGASLAGAIHALNSSLHFWKDGIKFVPIIPVSTEAGE